MACLCLVSVCVCLHVPVELLGMFNYFYDCVIALALGCSYFRLVLNMYDQCVCVCMCVCV